jgi:hypothetical protein
VLMSMGKTLPMNIMKIADSRPTPNHKIANGIQAIGGIGLSMPINRLERSLTVLDQPITIPKGIPTSAETANPSITLNKVSEVSVISSPFIKSASKAFNTSDGLGRKYDGINPVNVVRMAQIIITETGNISEIHIFRIF